MIQFSHLQQFDWLEHGMTEAREDWPEGVIQGEQVHKTKTVWVKGKMESPVSGADAFWTKEPEVAVGVRTADCVPLILVEPAARIVGVVHAGWRGTALEITRKAIEELGFAAHKLMVGIGPAIGPESFIVGEEVAEQFPRSVVEERDGQFHVDLWQANILQCVEMGVSERNIEVVRRDTFTDDALYSFRGGDKDCRMLTWVKKTA